MRILTLEEAKEYRRKLFPMGKNEYSPTVTEDRSQYLWLIKLLYDNGVAIVVEDK